MSINQRSMSNNFNDNEDSKSNYSDSDSYNSDSESSNIDDINEGEDDDHDYTSDIDNDILNIQCLFCYAIEHNTEIINQHMSTTHRFDLIHYILQHKLNYYQTISLINYIRYTVQNSITHDDIVDKLYTDNKNDIYDNILNNEQYLKPVLDNDELIQNLDDTLFDDDINHNNIDIYTVTNQVNNIKITNNNNNNNDNMSMQLLIQQNQQLQEQVNQLQHTIQTMQLTMKRQIDEDNINTKHKHKHNNNNNITTEQNYFDSYSAQHIHIEMLQDSARTNAYQEFIYNNTHLISGKICIDVGAGSGILSLFLVKAGARHVFAIEASNIVDKLQQIVNDNNYTNRITIIHKRVEDIKPNELLYNKTEKPSCIVSEWMVCI